MSAAKLIGLTASAAQACADARGDPVALEIARETLAACFDGLNAEEAAALGSGARALLEPRARRTGDYRAWADVCYYKRLPSLWEAAVGFRERLDADVNRRGEWERKQQQAQTEHAERDLRRAVRPLFRRGASKAEIEEAAGRFADIIPWEPTIFRVLTEELEAARG